MASTIQPSHPGKPPDPSGGINIASLASVVTAKTPTSAPIVSASAAPAPRPSFQHDFPPLPSSRTRNKEDKPSFRPSAPSTLKISSAASTSAVPPFVPTASPPSYASVTAGSILQPRFPPILLSPRQADVKDGNPAISFTDDEVQVGSKRFNFSLVAKFTFGKPPLAEIQRAFQAHWKISGRATISEVWDSRHVLVILDSEEDVTTALSCPLRKINQSMFRLFRWSIDYNSKKESTTTTAWVRLPRLPIPLYDRAYIGVILSTFAHFLDVDDRTKACLSLKFARACIEIDVTQSIPDKVWVNMGGADGYWQDIEVETKLAYCSKCRVHGHDVAVCRKAKASMEHKRKNAIKSDYGPDNLFNVTTIQYNHERADENGESSNHDSMELPSTEMSSSGRIVIAPADEYPESRNALVCDVDTGKAHDDGPKDDHLALVIYNGSCVSSDVRSEMNENVPLLSPFEGGQSSQEGQTSKPLVSTSLLQVEAHGDVSPPISEWIPSKKKRKNKGKKVVPSESESGLRCSSQVIQAVPNCQGLRHSSRSKKSSEHSDFVYHANEMKSGKGKTRKKVSFKEIAEVIFSVEDED